MSEQTHNAANMTDPEHARHVLVSPQRYTFACITLLIGAAITVVAAKLETGIFNPAL